MIEIKYVENKNKDFWYSLDKHLPAEEFEKKVRDKQGFLLTGHARKMGLAECSCSIGKKI